MLVDAVTPQSKSLSRTEVRQRPEIRNRIQDIAYRIRVLSDTLTEFATAIKFEREAVEAFNRMIRLASLPDDLLTMIFDYVVNKDENKDLIPIRWRTAVTLSHVCQHFRDVSLSCPRLWTTMNRSSRMVAACLPRAKGVPLAVDITLHPNLCGLAVGALIEFLQSSYRAAIAGVISVSTSTEATCLTQLMNQTY